MAANAANHDGKCIVTRRIHQIYSLMCSYFWVYKTCYFLLGPMM
jgi:hypothetical protein